jgi:hypothetical protein
MKAEDPWHAFVAFVDMDELKVQVLANSHLHGCGMNFDC